MFTVDGSWRRIARFTLALSLATAPAVALSGPSVAPRVARPDVARPRASAETRLALTAEQTQLLTAVLKGAAAEGLNREASSLEKSGSLPSDADLVKVTLDYARAVHSGQLRARDFLLDWGVRPAPYDPTAGFAAAIREHRLASWVTSLPPHYAGYDALRKALAAYRKIEASGGWNILAGGPDLTLGT